MKQLKPRDKVTQHMTRDGLTLDNQTTGKSINISSREAEQDYSAAEPGGTAEKVLERAGDIRERSKAKRAAKDGANTAAQATGPASRLQFTAEERADPALSKYVHKAEKRADKLDAAKEALPKKRVVTKEIVYDEAKGKAKTKLHFDKVEKPAPKLKPNPASRPMEEAGLYLHGKIHEVEHENVGVEGGHKGEELAERQAGKTRWPGSGRNRKSNGTMPRQHGRRARRHRAQPAPPRPPPQPPKKPPRKANRPRPLWPGTGKVCC